MDREQVIEQARRLAAQGDYEAACVLRWLAPEKQRPAQGELGRPSGRPTGGAGDGDRLPVPVA